jgi:hypothetical protein
MFIIPVLIFIIPISIFIIPIVMLIIPILIFIIPILMFIIPILIYQTTEALVFRITETTHQVGEMAFSRIWTEMYSHSIAYVPHNKMGALRSLVK